MLDTLSHSSSVLADLDVAAIVQRRPDVVLLDDLAHVDTAGGGRVHRWREVAALLDAGIDVVSTMKVEQVESLADAVRNITGIAPEVSVPDEFLSRADQIELVDITPEAMRRRIAHGNVFDSDGLDLATLDLFSGSGFAELRALLLFWLADRLTAGADDPREAHERVVVAVTGGPGSDAVVRRAARLAQRSRAALIGVHVRSHRRGSDDELSARRELVEALGGRYHEVVGVRVPEALVEFAHAQRATQLVVGRTGRPALTVLWRGSIVNQILRRAGSIDVHVTSYPATPGHGGSALWGAVSPIPRATAARGFRCRSHRADRPDDGPHRVS